eukprot:2141292-Pyramimonas_sp.AAC.1
MGAGALLARLLAHFLPHDWPERAGEGASRPGGAADAAAIADGRPYRAHPRAVRGEHLLAPVSYTHLTLPTILLV